MVSLSWMDDGAGMGWYEIFLREVHLFEVV
jgi:hypothetical protein